MGRHRPLGLVLSLGLALVACGGTASPSAVPSPPTTTATPAGPTSGSAQVRPGARCPASPSPTGPICVTIVIRDLAFQPATVRIPPNGDVVFVNEDTAAHSVVWADGSHPSSTLATGDSVGYSFGFAAGATIDYECGVHGDRMRGRIVVDPSMPIP